MPEHQDRAGRVLARRLGDGYRRRGSGGGITWGNALPAQYADHVVALATFGNIADRSGTPISSQSQLLGSKTIDVCNPSDPICHAGPGNQWSGHTEGYVPVYTDQAARFIAARLLAGQPHLPGDSQPQPT